MPPPASPLPPEPMRLWSRLRPLDLVHRLGQSPERATAHRRGVLSNYRSLLRLSKELHGRLAPAAGEYVLAAARDRFRRHALERSPDVISRLKLRGAHAEITARRALGTVVGTDGDGDVSERIERKEGWGRCESEQKRQTQLWTHHHRRTSTIATRCSCCDWRTAPRASSPVFSGAASPTACLLSRAVAAVPRATWWRRGGRGRRVSRGEREEERKGSKEE